MRIERKKERLSILARAFGIYLISKKKRGSCHCASL
jgi:hypothetical protein